MSQFWRPDQSHHRLEIMRFVENIPGRRVTRHKPDAVAGFLQPLIQLLAYEENEEIQCHAISTLRNLAASSEKNKRAIVDAGAVERVKELVLNVPLGVQSEMTACVAVLALSGKFTK